MKKLLQRSDNYRWDLSGIEFAIQERIGDPRDFIGRVRELELLYAWAGRIQRGISRSSAFLGRRKVGKSLILERLYNILYSEKKGLLPFYYEFSEGKRSGKEFYRDFTTRFYMQAVGYYTRDIAWIRRAVNKDSETDVEALLQEVERLSFTNKEIIVSRLLNTLRTINTDKPAYEYVIAAVDAPAGFATMVGVKDKVAQLIDEFQYMNMYIDAGVVDKPSMAYMSTAEKKSAPLLITGSLMGVVSQELARYLPQRFYQIFAPKMKAEESIAMTLNYGRLYGHRITPEIAAYIAYVTNGIPGRIVELLTPSFDKANIATLDDVDRALEFEVGEYGNIKSDWDEYLALAMDKVNALNMRRITYFLCKNEGTWYYPGQLKSAMALKIEDRQLRKELDLLRKYDIIEMDSGRYGGVFDRTLKKVLMKNYGEILNLPLKEFESYFKNDNMLDYLQERVELLKLSLAETRTLRQKLAKLRGEHNNLKGHYYEREVLLGLIKAIIDGDGGLVAGISVTSFTYTLNYHLESGEEIDIVLAGEQAVVMAECKNYTPDNLDKIKPGMVDDFIDKAARLRARFSGKDLRLGFFSKHGFEKSLETYLSERGLVFTLPSTRE